MAALDNLPAWRCHKVVKAARIEAAMPNATTMQLGLVWDALDGYSTCREAIDVDMQWCVQHKPELGGYLVVYEDGTTSYSPAEAFKTSYDRVE